jgi:hypothetical protein
MFGVLAQSALSCDLNQIRLIYLDFVQSLVYLKGKPETRQQLIPGGALIIGNTMEHFPHQHSTKGRQAEYYNWRLCPFRNYGLIVMVN